MYHVVFVVILKYYVSLWVQNWDIIQILELNTLNCHIKGLKMSRFMCFLRVNLLEVRKYACVKDLTNFMVGRDFYTGQKQQLDKAILGKQ